MQIRLASENDIPALSYLIPESVRTLSIGFYTTPQIESAIINIFGVDSQIIIDHTYYVAETNGEIVGCGGWSKRKTLFGGDQFKTVEADSLLNPATEPARIRAFFVHPRWVRRGIGSRILEICEEEAKINHFTRMELIATLPGIPLYTKFGYKVIERFEVTLPEELSLPIALMTKHIQR